MPIGLILCVAAGGALGSVARYLLAGQVTAVAGAGFPWGILTVNVLGSAVIGALTEAGTLALPLSAEMRALLITGVLGGFTTFSAFSLDMAELIRAGDWLLAGVYASASVVLSVAAFFAAAAGLRAVIA